MIRFVAMTLLLSQLSCAQITMSGGMSTSGGIMLGPPVNLFGQGDSITAGAGADNPVFFNDYVGQVMTHYGWQQQNAAVGGSGIGDWASFQYQAFTRTTTNQTTVGLFGENDVGFAFLNTGNGSLDLTQWAKAAMANILYSTILFTDQLKAGTASWTKVGTWTAGNSGAPRWDTYSMSQTSTPGDTATVSVTGTVLYLVYLADQPSGNVSFNVSIDNVSQGNFSNQGTVQAVPTFLFRYYPEALRFPGLSAGSHSLKVTYNSGSVPLILMWTAGNKGTSPRFFTGNCIHTNTGVSDADYQSINAAFATLVAEIAGDGLRAILVDADSVINPATDVSGAHPTQGGYNKIANKFISVIDANP